MTLQAHERQAQSSANCTSLRARAAVPGTADEGEDRTGRKGEDAAPAVENPLLDFAAEANPMLDLFLAPDQLDMREARRCCRWLNGLRAGC